MVLGLYMFPIVFVSNRAWTIFHDGVPSLQTSMSTSWGNLPKFYFCSSEGWPDIMDCDLRHVEPANASWTSSKEQTVKKPKGLRKWCDSIDSDLSQADATALTKIGYTSVSWLKKNCSYLDVSALEPSPTLVGTFATTSALRLDFRIKGAARQPLSVLVYDEKVQGHLQVLTGVVPGKSVVILTKKRQGQKRFSANPAFQNLTWSSLLSPSLYANLTSMLFSPQLADLYSAQLEFEYPDTDVEDPAEALTHDRYSNMSSKTKALLRKVLQHMKAQHYSLTLKIPSNHVLEEVEIGRYPQILLLLARLGGYMSLLSAVLGVCWVQKWPKSEVAETYDRRTLFCSDRSITKPQLEEIRTGIE